jgi:hypothetical protein
VSVPCSDSNVECAEFGKFIEKAKVNIAKGKAPIKLPNVDVQATLKSVRPSSTLVQVPLEEPVDVLVEAERLAMCDTLLAKVTGNSTTACIFLSLSNVLFCSRSE